MRILRNARRVTTVALAAATATVAFAAPAVAAPTAASGASSLAAGWALSYGEARASGTTTLTPDMLSYAQTVAVKGAIKTPAAGGCYFVQINTGQTTLNSPSVCGASSSASFSTTFKSLVFEIASARLCSGQACGAASNLW